MSTPDMTLRQWYAGQALASIRMLLVLTGTWIKPDDIAGFARLAVNIADAVIEALEQDSGHQP